MSLCKDCTKGIKHDGTPEGEIVEINGVDCYVAVPQGHYDTSTVVLMLTDGFGLDLVNNKLLADDFARHGFKTVAPNLFKDPVPADALDAGSSFDFLPWLERNSIEYSEPRVRKVLAALQGQGATKIAVTGYCYGVRTGFNLAFENAITVLAVSHPSMLQVPQDFETLKARSNVPVLINSCEIDQAFSQELQKIADQLLGDGQYAPGYRRTYWEGCTHGFAVRGDLSDPKVLAGKEGSFKATCTWFHQYL